MIRTIATACVLAVMSGGIWAQQSAPTAPSQKPSATKQVQKKSTVRKKAPTKTKTTAVAPAKELPAQTMPPVPATLMNSAPIKPSVTMQNGLLTIDAPNSTLRDVLAGVHKATGATIEGPSPSERVAVKLGPGNPEQVMAALLQGTPYDYVILGSLEKSDALTRVILTQASQSAAASTYSPAPQPAPSEESDQPTENAPANAPANGLISPGHRMPAQVPPQPAEEPAPDDSNAGQPATDEQQEQQAQPQAQPQQQPDANQSKTPDQLFRELQQLEQQKQQSQQQR